jgi:hypothetical protein
MFRSIVRRPDKHHRTRIRLTSLNKIINQREDQDSSKHDGGPIQRHCGDFLLLWPSGPKQDEKTVDEADAVDPDAPSPETPLRGWETFVCGNAFVQNASDGNAVCTHEGKKLKRNDGVEGDRGAEIDKGQKNGDDASHIHCISRYGLVMHLYTEND